MTKTLRVTGLDPVSGGVETVDLLKQKLVRRVEMAKSTERSKVSTTRRLSAHRAGHPGVRQTDVPHAAVIF